MNLLKAITKQTLSSLDSYDKVNLSVGSTPYSKGQLLWYHKVPVEVTSTSSIQMMEEQYMMLLVRVIDVHHDDFPNIYYTIKAIQPSQTTTKTTANSTNHTSSTLLFEQEKQTDLYHLCPLTSKSIEKYKAFSLATSIVNPKTEVNTCTRNKESNEMILKNLQESLCKLGPTINLNVNYSNKQYVVSLGTFCTISQLKIMICATIGHLSVPDVKLIHKGVILKDNQQKITETKLVNNAKIIVMSSYK